MDKYIHLYKCTYMKILLNSCFATYSSSTCQESFFLIRTAQPPLTQNSQELTSNSKLRKQKSIKVKHQIRNKFTIKSLWILPQCIRQSSISPVLLKVLWQRGINIYITKELLINITLNDNRYQIQYMPVNIVHANGL